MVELTHEYLCDKISENILNSIHSGRSRWGQIFDSKHVVELSAGRDWPSPDFIHFDTKKNIKCAYEFKPPDEEKGEYVKGVGQAIAYRNYLDYSTLIIPIKPIGEEIKEIVKREKLKIGLILYEPSASIKELLSSLTLEIPIKLEKKRKLKQITTYPFWAYYRDASLEEIFLMLDYSNKLKDRSEPDIRDLVFNKLFKDMTAGKTKTLGGTRRTIRNTAKNRQNYQKNYTSLFNHLWLWHSTGRLLTFA